MKTYFNDLVRGQRFSKTIGASPLDVSNLSYYGTYCSSCLFQEFVADEGKIYIPYWMLQNLMLEEGGIVQVLYFSHEFVANDLFDF